MSDSAQAATHNEATDQALEVLSSEFRSSLLRYFSRKVSDRALAEDLVQEVFLRLVKRTEFDDRQPGARGYVFETANSVWCDWLKRRRVRQAETLDGLDEEPAANADFSPERVLIGRERLAEATAALLELPERTRIIFVLRRIDGLKCKDIAIRLNISVSAVEKHLVRAMAHLMMRVSDARQRPDTTHKDQ